MKLHSMCDADEHLPYVSHEKKLQRVRWDAMVVQISILLAALLEEGAMPSATSHLPARLQPAAYLTLHLTTAIIIVFTQLTPQAECEHDLSDTNHANPACRSSAFKVKVRDHGDSRDYT
jgi:hypothetical protein